MRYFIGDHEVACAHTEEQAESILATTDMVETDADTYALCRIETLLKLEESRYAL